MGEGDEQEKAPEAAPPTCEEMVRDESWNSRYGGYLSQERRIECGKPVVHLCRYHVDAKIAVADERTRRAEDALRHANERIARISAAFAQYERGRAVLVAELTAAEVEPR